MKNRKLVIYIMYPQTQNRGDHPFLVMRRTLMNRKKRYVTSDEILKLGILWPSAVAKTKDELASIIGHAVLDEVHPPTYVVPGPALAQQLKAARRQMIEMSPDDVPDENPVDGPGGPDDEVEEPEMPWEHAAAEAIERATRGAHWDDHEQGVVVPDFDSVTADGRDHESYVCRTIEELRRTLFDIGGRAWGGSVPIEGGLEVFEWSSGASESFVDRGVEAMPELVERLHVE